MKIIASCVVVVGIFVLGIYMSGGTDKFLANLLSTNNGNEESEIIDLDAPRDSANIADAVSAKKSKTTKQVVQKPKCVATSSVATHQGVRINEIAWMGSDGDATREWIELKNISSDTISLNGWEFLDKSGRIDIRFDASASILSNAFLVLLRGKEFTGTINNSNEVLSLFNSNCILVDMVEANPSWPAGDAKSGRPAERNDDFSWRTSTISGGTPGRENSAPLVSSSAPIGVTTSSMHIGKSNTSQPIKVLISEVMTGAKGNANYDFIELYNDSDAPASLTGLSIKKKSSTGKESSLVAESRLTGKIIPAHQYFLLANDGGYTGNTKPDIKWPSSYSLASAKNGVILYDTNNKVIDSASWDTIPDGASFVRDGWNSAIFHINSTPTPQNSSSR